MGKGVGVAGIKDCRESGAHGDDEGAIVKELEEHNLFTGLFLGLSDYEICVRDVFYKMIRGSEVSSVLKQLTDEHQNGGKRKACDISLADSEVPLKKLVSRAAEDD